MQSISFAKIMRQKGIKPPPLCFVAKQNIGEEARSDRGVSSTKYYMQFFQPPRPAGTPPISSAMSRGRGLKVSL